MSATLSLDFADPAREAAVLLRIANANGERGAWLVLDRGLATEGESAPNGLRLADDGERAIATLKVDAGELELEATRSNGVTFERGSAFADATGAPLEAFAARVRGEWRLGDRRSIDAAGRIVRIAGDPDWTRVELVRSLTAVLDDGSLLVVAAARPTGASGHGDEVTEAAIVDAAGAVTRFEEALISTEYGADGRHRRAGVELWAAGDAAALRGAGTLIGGTSDTAFLSFRLNGGTGTARYDLVRGA